MLLELLSNFTFLIILYIMNIWTYYIINCNRLIGLFFFKFYYSIVFKHLSSPFHNSINLWVIYFFSVIFFFFGFLRFFLMCHISHRHIARVGETRGFLV